MKKKIIMAAPFDSNGRYAGGVSYVANAIVNATTDLSENEIEIVKFETCRIQRKKDEPGEINVKNIINALLSHLAITGEIKAAKADILYFHTSVGFSLLKDIWTVRRAKRRTGIKTVLHIHFAEYSKIMTGKKMIDRLIEKWISKYIDRVIFLSHATMEEFIMRGGDKNKCAVIYNFNCFNIAEEQMAEKFAKKRDVTKFLFVGSMDIRKGIVDALRCFAKIEDPFEFHVCGVATNETIKDIFGRYQEKLGEKLIYHGYLNGQEKEDVYRDADVLLLPSYGEGLPIVILEAYSAGCAVISTNVGAIPEIVTEQNGTLINPGDKWHLLRTLLSYIHAPDEWLREKQMQNYKDGQNYSIANFIKSVSDICDQIL